jgi:hypothetical protein
LARRRRKRRLASDNYLKTPLKLLPASSVFPPEWCARNLGVFGENRGYKFRKCKIFYGEFLEANKFWETKTQAENFPETKTQVEIFSQTKIQVKVFSQTKIKAKNSRSVNFWRHKKIMDHKFHKQKNQVEFKPQKSSN